MRLMEGGADATVSLPVVVLYSAPSSGVMNSRRRRAAKNSQRAPAAPTATSRPAMIRRDCRRLLPSLSSPSKRKRVRGDLFDHLTRPALARGFVGGPGNHQIFGARDMLNDAVTVGVPAVDPVSDVLLTAAALELLAKKFKL